MNDNIDSEMADLERAMQYREKLKLAHSKRETAARERAEIERKKEISWAKGRVAKAAAVLRAKQSKHSAAQLTLNHAQNRLEWTAAQVARAQEEYDSAVTRHAQLNAGSNS